ncbi:hypothetical protein C2E23DRAFT_831591 [Lenzites betulinus]|nr:hypothetical protein C2E23DRAFT_831591 [Lenzites betulinus]
MILRMILLWPGMPPDGVEATTLVTDIDNTTRRRKPSLARRPTDSVAAAAVLAAAEISSTILLCSNYLKQEYEYAAQYWTKELVMYWSGRRLAGAINGVPR